MKWLLLLLTIPLLAFSPPNNIPEFECNFGTTPCTGGTFVNNAELANQLILDRDARFTINNDFTMSKGTIKLSVEGLVSYNNATLCDAYWSQDLNNWNSSCPRIHELAKFYDGDEEVFSIIATEKYTQYEPVPATIRVLFDSPNSPYTDPAKGVVSQFRDGVICRFNNLSSHDIEIHYDFSTVYEQGIEYVNTSDYIFITCDGEQGRPRIMDEIPQFNITKIVFENTHESIPEEEVLRINYFSFDNQDIEWCGNGYCASGEASCARDCGCSEGYLYWLNNSCYEGNNLEYFGYYRRAAVPGYEVSPGNLFISPYYQNNEDQAFVRGNEGADDLAHSSFGHGEIPLSENVCLRYEEYGNKVINDLLPYEFAWSIFDEPTHRTHQFSLETVDYVVSGIKNIYPQLTSYVVFNRNELLPESIDWVGIDPYHYPYRTDGCEEYGSYFTKMYYDWNQKASPSLTHYQQFDKPILLIGRAFAEGNWDIPSLCQQNWYLETAKGNPEVNGLAYFAWEHDAVSDIVENNNIPGLIDWHTTAGENFTTATRTLVNSSIPEDLYPVKNDFSYDENLSLPIIDGSPLYNGAKRYSETFTVLTPKEYTVRYYTRKHDNKQDFSLGTGETYDFLNLKGINGNSVTIIINGLEYTLNPLESITANNKIIFYKQNDGLLADFYIADVVSSLAEGFLVNDSEEFFEVKPNGNQAHVGKIRDLDPNNYDMLSLDFTRDIMCNSYEQIIGGNSKVIALKLDNKIFPVWYDLSGEVYLAFENHCLFKAETCNSVDDNCNGLVDEFCYGDLNGNAIIEIEDVFKARDFYGSNSSQSNWGEAVLSDQNNDGIVNIVDILMIINLID